MSFDLGYVVFSEHVLTLYSHATKCSGAVISILYICICMYQEPVNRKIEIPTELTEYVFPDSFPKQMHVSVLLCNPSNSRFEAKIRNNISRVINGFFGSFTILLLRNFRHILC